MAHTRRALDEPDNTVDTGRPFWESDMMGWGNGHGWVGFGWIFMLLFWGLVIVGLIALVRWLLVQGTASRDAPGKKALEILQERYARGEIERDEYEQKRRDLGG